MANYFEMSRKELAAEKEKWIGPNAWRSEGACWTESYRLKRLGIRSRPEVEFRL